MNQFSRLILFAAFAPAAYSQSLIYTFDGDSPGDMLGISVSGAGDVNGDGFDDMLVGAFTDDNNGNDSGSARVLSGADGSLLYLFDGDLAQYFFGWSVSGAGDVNGDGFDDVIVGAPGSPNGSARVLSGIDGSTLHDWQGDSFNDQFGHSVSGAGDVNGDGFDDLIVGAYFDDNNGNTSGSARVFSGLDGTELYTFDGDSAFAALGWSVSGAGDVNDDGFDDVIVGAHWNSTSNGALSGTAYVYSGVDGSELYAFDGDSADDHLGTSVSGAGDVNGDGFDDLIVGAPDVDHNGNSSGSARVFSGANGSVLYTLYGDSLGHQFGISVSGANDLNGDGFDDLIVGATGAEGSGQGAGEARVFSGLNGTALYTLDGTTPGSAFGHSVSDAGDVNGDGLNDLIVGAFVGGSTGSSEGSTHVFSGCDACPKSIGQNYCGPAVSNSTGLPGVISGFGSDVAALNNLELTAAQLPSNKFGYFLNSDVQGFVASPPGSQGNLCLSGAIGRHIAQVTNTGANGVMTLVLDLTALPRQSGTHTVVAGETWNFQCWFRDRNPGQTTNFTDGLSVLFK